MEEQRDGGWQDGGAEGLRSRGMEEQRDGGTEG